MADAIDFGFVLDDPEIFHQVLGLYDFGRGAGFAERFRYFSE
jgi:hypothetical protein